MTLLLTMLSVLALWTLLATLVVGLLLILKPLEGIRGHLRQITTGVRAIERETATLDARASALAPALRELLAALPALPSALTAVDRDLNGARAAVRRALGRS